MITRSLAETSAEMIQFSYYIIKYIQSVFGVKGKFSLSGFPIDYMGVVRRLLVRKQEKLV